MGVAAAFNEVPFWLDDCNQSPRVAQARPPRHGWRQVQGSSTRLREQRWVSTEESTPLAPLSHRSAWRKGTRAPRSEQHPHVFKKLWVPFSVPPPKLFGQKKHTDSSEPVTKAHGDHHPQIFGVFARPSVPPEIVINVQIRSTHVYGLQVKYTMRTKRLEVPQTAQRLDARDRGGLSPSPCPWAGLDEVQQ